MGNSKWKEIVDDALEHLEGEFTASDLKSVISERGLIEKHCGDSSSLALSSASAFLSSRAEDVDVRKVGDDGNANVYKRVDEITPEDGDEPFTEPIAKAPRSETEENEDNPKGDEPSEGQGEKGRIFHRHEVKLLGPLDEFKSVRELYYIAVLQALVVLLIIVHLFVELI